MNKEYYIYCHKKPNDEIFYIGMGKANRAFSTSDRNNLWKKIVKKYGKHKVEILINNITRDEAIQIEMYLIGYYGRINNNTGILSNLTNGGDGGSFGSKQSKETIEKRVKHLRGKKIKDEVKVKIGLKQKGGDNHYAKSILDLKTGIFYETIKEAAFAKNIHYGKLRKIISGVIKNNVDLIPLND